MHTNQTRSHAVPTRARAAAIAAALTIIAVPFGAAHATPAIAIDEAPKPPKERRTEVDVGMLFGGMDIGPTQRHTVGFHINVGRRFGDLVLLGEYDYLSLGRDTLTGTMSRFGAVARYSLLRTKDKRSPVTGDYWVEAGAGFERVVWDDGGELARPDLALGLGVQWNTVIGRKSDKPRYFGPFVAFRALAARAPEHAPGAEPTCASICDTMTLPSRNDVSMFLHVGFNWGHTHSRP